ncbi:MAG TPA: GNAT family N-acetyltransferase, partial [Methanomassiliicoccales archaeon]|nr:MAG: Acetyltransferase (GNAT) family protein [Methanomassiliicoccales archaeon PtaB.Bin215]HNU36587.1 GNAT family N-acetyltransferase [Methanomassiliicoccales archaeon]
MRSIEHKDHDGSREELAQLAEMLGESFSYYGSLQNWSLNRIWDWRLGGNAVAYRDDPAFFQRNLHIWRSNGKPVAFVISERGKEFSLQVHPDHRDLEEEMLRWAERTWGKERKPLITTAYGTDMRRQRVLLEHGFERGDSAGFIRKYDLSLPIEPVKLKEGFRLMSMAEFGTPEKYVEAVRGAFGRPVLNMDWFRSKVSAPGYSDEWNIVVVSPDGRIASFCDARIDWKRGYAEVDPIGTHPDFQRQGFARACILECFHRMSGRGIRYSFIGSAAEPAPSNRLYDSLAPVEKHEEHLWVKRS